VNDMTHFTRDLDAHQQQMVDLNAESGYLSLFDGEDRVTMLDPYAVQELYAFLHAHQDTLTRVTNRPYTVYWNTRAVGCFGTDDNSNPWATFQHMGNGFVTCQECGKEIASGWSRGMLGEEEHFCSSHIRTQYREG